MKQEHLEQLGQDLEKAFKELESTINQVGRLKDIVSSLNIASEEIKQLFEDIASHENLQAFKKQNSDITKELRENIGSIENNINKILTQRNLFVEIIETYDLRFQKFENMVKQETETTERMFKQVSKLLAQMENDQKNLNARIDRFNKVVDSADVISKYDELMKEIRNNTRLLTKIKEESDGMKSFKGGLRPDIKNGSRSLPDLTEKKSNRK